MANKTFTKLSDLFKYIEQNHIKPALENDVAEKVKDTMSNVIENVTYNQYIPKEYKRRGVDGGLASKQNMRAEMIDDNTLAIKNMTTGNEEYAPPRSQGYDEGTIDHIIVSGKGYHWTNSAIHYPIVRRSPLKRNFYEATREELQNTNDHVHSMYKGLKNRGIDVRIK